MTSPREPRTASRTDTSWPCCDAQQRFRVHRDAGTPTAPPGHPRSSELSMTLASRHLLSPLDTDPDRRLPEGLRPAVETHRPPPAHGGRLRRHAALAHRGGGAGGRRRGRTRGPMERRNPARRLTERRSLRFPRRADCAFRSRRRPGGVGRNPPPACGALWEVAQLGKCVRATPPPGCGGVAPGIRRPRPEAWLRGSAPCRTPQGRRYGNVRLPTS